MARKTKTVVITQEGRDQGKQFLITEMPATRAEKWALRVFLAVGSSGANIPDVDVKLGMVGMLYQSLQMLVQIPFEKAEPLLDEMMDCVKIEPTPGSGVVRPLMEGDIEEVSTLFQLRKDVLDVHIGFFPSGGGLTSESPPPTQSQPSSLNIKTPRSSSPRR